VTAVTGVAGAGKSSLAFEVLHAEDYRRYVETLSPYARKFLERFDRPQAERIEGARPSIAINRTTPIRTSRSTVGTATAIADYMRGLYARASTLSCRQCAERVERQTAASIFEALLHAGSGPALICFPLTTERIPGASLRDLLQRLGFRRSAFRALLHSCGMRSNACARRSSKQPAPRTFVHAPMHWSSSRNRAPCAHRIIGDRQHDAGARGRFEIGASGDEPASMDEHPGGRPLVKAMAAQVA
jgi:excinuclease UvrABC ATPase subunit